MSDDHAELSSLSLLLDQVTQRLVDVADRHRGTEHHGLTSDLDEVERSLRRGSRRLARLIRSEQSGK